MKIIERWDNAIADRHAVHCNLYYLLGYSGSMYFFTYIKEMLVMEYYFWKFILLGRY